MRYTYVVLGAGRQGQAIAYDLALNCEAAEVILADCDAEAASKAVRRLSQILPGAAPRLAARAVNVERPDEVLAVIRGADVVISAVPYRYNVRLTDAALSVGASFCDLGGNTAVVREQLERHPLAVRAGVSVVPDCGLAPGLGNHLAAHGVNRLDDPHDVHVRCGGLPEQPVGPLGYKLLFNFQGLINEYSGHGEFLRNGQLTHIPALSELETIEFDPPVGRCEAAVTSGGTSTCAITFRGRLRSYDYKTVRYPGHFAIIRALFELGLFEDRVKLSDGRVLEPRSVTQPLFEDRLRFPNVTDIVVLRVIVRGAHQKRPAWIQYDVLDRQDARTGFTAMERTTGFPTALVAHLQARRLVAPGASPLELSVPAARFFDELARHDIRVRVTSEGI